MAESYSTFKLEGPTIDPNLIVNATTAGIAQGNAQKTTTQSVINGAITGIKDGISIVSGVQGIQSQSLANSAAATQNDINSDPAVIAAKKDAGSQLGDATRAETALKTAQATELIAKAKAAGSQTPLQAMQQLVATQKAADTLNSSAIDTASQVSDGGQSLLSILRSNNDPAIGYGATAGRDAKYTDKVVASLEAAGLTNTPEYKSFQGIQQNHQIAATKEYAANFMTNANKAYLDTQKTNIAQGAEYLQQHLNDGLSLQALPAEGLKLKAGNTIEVTGDTYKDRPSTAPVGVREGVGTNAYIVNGDKIVGTIPTDKVGSFDKAQEHYNSYRNFVLNAMPAATIGAVAAQQQASATQAAKSSFNVTKLDSGIDSAATTGENNVKGPTPPPLPDPNFDADVKNLPAAQQDRLRSLRDQKISTQLALKTASPSERTVVSRINNDPAIGGEHPAIKALAMTEGYHAKEDAKDQTSYTGVTGPFQITGPTWRGLEKLAPDIFAGQDKDDPAIGALAAKVLIAQGVTKYGTMDAALVSYNAGDGVMAEAFSKSGGLTSYAELKPYIAEAVRNNSELKRLEEKDAASDKPEKDRFTREKKIHEVDGYVTRYYKNFSYFS